jgi:Zn ribbon nucleic-acid-binding protein
MIKLARKITHEDFCNEVKNLVGNEYLVLGKYEKRHNLILMKHIICNYEWEVSPNNFIHGTRCPLCNGKLQKTHDEFVEIVKNLVGNEYIVLSNFTKINAKVKMKHNINDCGHEWYIRAGSFTNQGNRCPICSIRKSSEQYSYQLNEIYNGEYILNCKYITNKKKISVIHTLCDTEFEVYPNDLLNGDTSCPNCYVLKNERRIRLWLTENNLEFISQMKFDGLIGLGGGKLSYDFYLPKLNLLIEYQGEFHDGKANDFVSQNLETQQEHDRRKKEYAKLHNINLLEIWYWDKNNIDAILDCVIYNN